MHIVQPQGLKAVSKKVGIWSKRVVTSWTEYPPPCLSWIQGAVRLKSAQRPVSKVYGRWRRTRHLPREKGGAYVSHSFDSGQRGLAEHQFDDQPVPGNWVITSNDGVPVSCSILDSCRHLHALQSVDNHSMVFRVLHATANSTTIVCYCQACPCE